MIDSSGRSKKALNLSGGLLDDCSFEINKMSHKVDEDSKPLNFRQAKADRSNHERLMRASYWDRYYEKQFGPEIAAIYRRRKRFSV